MNFNFKNKEITVEKKARDYSLKLGVKRFCNLTEKDGVYRVKCRNKKYADLLPVEYITREPYLKTRNYKTYYATLSKAQVEEWVNKCDERGIDECLENRDKVV